MKCYKVVREKNGKYYSAIITGKYRLEYPLNHWVKSKIGKIFLYNNKKEALEIANRLGKRFKVFEADAIGVQKPYFIGVLFPANFDALIELFWQNGRMRLVERRLSTKTVWADEIKLMEEVK